MEGPSIRRLYYSSKDISNVAGVGAEELRTWERRFPVLRPSKSKTGRRLYRAADLDLIRKISDFLNAGMNDDSINEALRNPDAVNPILEVSGSSRDILLEIRRDLNSILDLLKKDPSPHKEEENPLFGRANPPEQD